MLDQHERHAGVRRHVGKEVGERLQPAGRGADRHGQVGQDGRRLGMGRSGLAQHSRRSDAALLLPDGSARSCWPARHVAPFFGSARRSALPQVRGARHQFGGRQMRTRQHCNGISIILPDWLANDGARVLGRDNAGTAKKRSGWSPPTPTSLEADQRRRQTGWESRSGVTAPAMPMRASQASNSGAGLSPSAPRRYSASWNDVLWYDSITSSAPGTPIT